MSRTARITIRTFLSLWLALETHLLIVGLWSFRGPQTLLTDGFVHHRWAERADIETAAIIYGGLVGPAAVGIVIGVPTEAGLESLGNDPSQNSGSIVGFIFDWLQICLGGLAQWYLALRGFELAIRKIKFGLKHQVA